MLVLVLVIVIVIVTVDIIGIIIRNIWVMTRCITIVKMTTRRSIAVTVIIRTITGVMVIVIWIFIRYIIIVLAEVGLEFLIRPLLLSVV